MQRLISRTWFTRFLLATGLMVLLTSSLGAYTQTRITTENLVSLAWSDGKVFGVTLAGGLVESDDLGATFAEIEPAVLNTFELRAIAAAGDTLIAVGVEGLIYRSANAGETWATIDIPPILGELLSIAPGPMIGGQQSWVAGGFDGFDAIIGRSVDDGLTWSLVLDDSDGSGPVTGLAYDATAERWLAVGSDGFDGKSWTSVDGGATWTVATLPADTPGLRAVAADGEGNFIAVGDEGTILKWEAGAWVEAFASSVFETYYAVVSTGENTWVAAGQDSVMATFDGDSLTTSDPAAGTGDIRTLLYLPDPEDVLLQGGEELTDLDDPGPNPPDMTTAVLTIAMDGNGDLLLTLNIPDGEAGNTFVLESTTTLTGWLPVAGSEAVINAFPYTWAAIEIDPLEPRRFWRAVWVENP